MNEPPRISIIIPTLNEQDGILNLLTYLKKCSDQGNIADIIVADGGSTDDTLLEANKLSGIRMLQAPKGRSRQMNAGARCACGDILYFLHADSVPPPHFDRDIIKAVSQGRPAGCFRMKFDSTHPVLVFSQWFTRFNYKGFRGGDQSLFITKRLFEDLGGFNENFRVYEDCEFIGRVYKKASFRVIPRTLTTSARRYRKKGTIAIQYHFTVIHLKRFCGASAESLRRYYEEYVA